MDRDFIIKEPSGHNLRYHVIGRINPMNGLQVKPRIEITIPILGTKIENK